MEDAFFQMPTPFKGSDAKEGKLSYSKQYGGGIDILARNKIGARSELCVIELKDEYKKGEEPKEAIKQAIAYSAFLLKLVKSSKARGSKWLKYFKINSSNKNININAVISMPFQYENHYLDNEDTFFANEPLHVEGLGTITLHYMYFDKDIFNDEIEYNAENLVTYIPRNRT